MEKTGLLKGMRLCSLYQKMSPQERERIQQKRFQEIVSFAMDNSPYYKNLYSNVNLNKLTLTDLPPVTKTELMKNFDSWVTNPEVTYKDVQDFMENLDHIGRKLKGKYYVFTTSGSTGNPLAALYDDSANNIMSALAAARSYARREDLTAFIKKGGKSIGVFATGGFYLANSSIRSRLLKMPWKRKQINVTSALLPVEEIVTQLNEFKPAMLGGYPTNLELLIDEQKSGRLHIHPVIIMTGGEYLSMELRTKLSETFGCYVQTSYSCTEGGTVACECREKHFHINDDWVIIEAVDNDHNPVPDGVWSDKLLLTNLFNRVQPFIRYEVTDRIMMHHEKCSCGSTSPWIEIEGRTDDVLFFVQAGKLIRIPPLAVYAKLKEVHGLKRFQVVVSPENKIELRIEPVFELERQQVFEEARAALLSFLQTHGVTDVMVKLSEDLPKQHPVSGKFKHIICKH